MTDELLELYIKQHIEASDAKEVMFSWHGGEPLLAGIDFYKKAIGFQIKYKPADCVIWNGIQTNGTLINNEWCSFLARESFRIGISIDGPEEMHDHSRLTSGGNGSFRKVIEAYRMLKASGIEPEILCVLSQVNVGDPIGLYRFFKSLNLSYLTFLPLVMQTKGSVAKESVDGEAFGNFLCEIFDEWVENDIGKIKIQIFEEALRSAFSQDHTLCIFRKTCGSVPVVEHNGDFYSCDHYVDSGHLQGNITSHTLEELLNCERQKAFGLEKYSTLPEYCLGCEVLDMCHGECPRNRFNLTPDGQAGLNYLCEGYRQFFNHCRPFVDAVASIWKEK